MIDIDMIIIIGIILGIIIWIVSKFKESEVEEIRKGYLIQAERTRDIKYTDLDKPGKPLFSNKIMLVGKPDYIVKKGKTYIPVEIKRGNPDTPFKSHIMQLMAYCYLVEEKYDVKVPYGVIVYEDEKVEIEYTDEDKQELLDTMDIMRMEKEFHRNHHSSNKCRICNYKSVCKDKI